jgi:hypothetical protein
MPAVTVDLACAENEALLAEDPYLASLGEAVARGVADYFGSSG